MATYISKLRRGVKDDANGRNDWETYTAQENHMKPQDGELVLEYDNGVPRLKIGDGEKEFGELPYMSVDSFILPKQEYVSLSTEWETAADKRYYQEVDVTNATITSKSKVDLQPTAEQLSIFQEKDLTFVAENTNGTVRVYCVGQKPQNEYDIPVTVTEIITEEETIIGNTTATPYPRPDWNQTDSTKADYIKNKPNLNAKLDVATYNADMAGLRQDITNEAHFRGYLSTNAAVQALSADANDYAYSAESGTTWIYGANGWEDRGVPVPDQVIPASTSTPLMDGAASAGTENAYARGDHRHPSDSTKADKATTLDGYGITDAVRLEDAACLDDDNVYTGSNTFTGDVHITTTLGFGLQNEAYIEFDGEQVIFDNTFGSLYLQSRGDAGSAIEMDSGIVLRSDDNVQLSLSDIIEANACIYAPEFSENGTLLSDKYLQKTKLTLTELQEGLASGEYDGCLIQLVAVDEETHHDRFVKHHPVVVPNNGVIDVTANTSSLGETGLFTTEKYRLFINDAQADFTVDICTINLNDVSAGVFSDGGNIEVTDEDVLFYVIK